MVTASAGSGASPATVKRALEKVRAAALGLPEATERLSHSHPTFFVREKTFTYFQNDHHGDGRLAIWCAAPDGVQGELMAAEPERFFRPAYVGYRGWVGVRLDLQPAWDEIGEIIRDSYRCVAPKTLLKLLD
jgi:hypothetical protein